MNYLRFGLIGLFLCASQLFAATSAPEGAEAGITHRMMMLALQLGVLLFATRIGNVAFERIRMPGVLGELTAGMIVGPFLLGAIAFPGLPHGLFPMGQGFPVSPELYGFCSMASIVLLFVVGLETDIAMFLRYSAAGGAVGVGGVIASFVVGDLMAVWFGEYVFGRPIGFFDEAALFLGVISTATSVGITARILSERRKLDSPEGVTILAGAVIDDVLGIICLAIVLGVTAARGATDGIAWDRIGILALKAVGIWLVATALGIATAHRIGAFLKKFKDRSAVAVLALGLALVLSGLFEEAGMAMIIGAYIMGLSLSRTDLANLIREKLEPIYSFLVPIFFGVMGMMVDFRALTSKSMLLFGLIYAITAVIAKVVGCGLPALCFGFTPLGALRIGTGMVPRGEVALIVAGVGLGAGVLAPDVFGVAILMTLLTTLAAPPLLVALFRHPASGLRHQRPAAEDATLAFSFPTALMAEWVFSGLRDVYRTEGFFVHRLDHGQGLTQVRREAAVVNLRTEGEKLLVDCEPRHAPFVRVAVYEVLGELRGTIDRLSAPVDIGGIVGHVPAAGTEASAAKSALAQYVKPDMLIPQIRATSKPELIEELMSRLVFGGQVRDAKAALALVLAREESMSTGLQHGLAVPHARTDAVDHLVCVIGLKPEGIDFGALDGKPSRVFILMLSPEAAPSPHIEFMSTVVSLFTPEFCDGLLTSKTAARMAEYLLSAEQLRSLLLPAEQIRADSIVHRLEATDRIAAIDELLATLAKQAPFRHPAVVRDAILSRERQMSTGLEGGIAIPHCRTKEVNRPLWAIGLSPAGVDFGSIDGELSRVVLLMIYPESGHVQGTQLLATMIRAFTRAGVDRILACNTAGEVTTVLRESAGMRST